MGRHDLQDEDRNPVTGTGETFGRGGRHSRDLLESPTDVIPLVSPVDPEAPTDRFWADALYWLDVPADGSWMLADTQPIPTPQFQTPDQD